MEQKLDLIINMIKAQDKKLDSIKEEMNDKYDLLNEKYEALDGKYDLLSKEMNDKYDSLSNEMNSKYNKLESNQNRIEEKLDNLSNQVTVLEAYAHNKCEAALDGWISHLQIQEEIKNNVTILNSKTENYEIRISHLEDALEA